MARYSEPFVPGVAAPVSVEKCMAATSHLVAFILFEPSLIGLGEHFLGTSSSDSAGSEFRNRAMVGTRGKSEPSTGRRRLPLCEKRKTKRSRLRLKFAKFRKG
jgi:hypothetical protein